MEGEPCSLQDNGGTYLIIYGHWGSLSISPHKHPSGLEPQVPADCFPMKADLLFAFIKIFLLKTLHSQITDYTTR